MAVMVIVELPAQPDRTEELKAFIRSIIDGTREFAGCRGLSMHENDDDPNEVMLVEQWESRGAHEKYVAWRTERGDFPTVIGMLAGPPSIRYFDSLDL
ncbi:MAG: putative quinol monooxygenase [Actinomycetota bacterium]|jgi:quinol monooxygenase YgiN